MDINFESLALGDCCVTSSENVTFPAELPSSIVAYCEYGTLLDLRRSIYTAVSVNDRCLFAHVENRARRLSARSGGYPRITSAALRRALSDIEHARGLADDFVVKPCAAVPLGINVASAQVVADIEMARMFHGDTKRGRDWTLQYVASDCQAALERWRVHEAAILKAHPEITWSNPVIKLIHLGDHRPLFRVPVTL